VVSATVVHPHEPIRLAFCATCVPRNSGGRFAEAASRQKLLAQPVKFGEIDDMISRAPFWSGAAFRDDGQSPM
jgi:hypothetical protein